MSLNALRKITCKETKKLEHLLQAQTTENHQTIPILYREPGILTGYRCPRKSWFYYAVSIFQLHNETINIWTHAIATFIFIQKVLYIVRTTERQNDCEVMPLIVFGTCAIANSFLSVFAHTFHSKSSLCHYVCFQLDYVGIGFYAFGQSVLFLYISCPENVYEYLGPISLPVNVCLSWVVMLGGCLSKLLFKRPYPFKRRLLQIGSGGIHASFGSIPLMSRLRHCFVDKDCTIFSLRHHFLWMITMIICLFFFSSHLPEKRVPGKFDFIGQGHQIFHVFITLTILLQFNAAHEDILRNDGIVWKCHNVSGWELLSAMAVYTLGCIVIILLLINFVKKRIREDEKSA